MKTVKESETTYVRYTVKIEREGHWIAEVDEVRGARASGRTAVEALRSALRLAIEAIEDIPGMDDDCK